MTAVSGEQTRRRLRFPDGFVWGAATSAYQIEGAVDAGGRGRSIWDVYAHTPGRIVNGDHADVAADHFHRFREDVALMREFGLSAYRFSIAWPRVQPGGRGPVNEQGLDFYRRLVDALLEAGVEPYPTLFHWDLPQELQDAGGWPARDTAFRFADYAAIVAGALGDRLGHMMTLNEPWCSAFLGYGLGRHAPGIHDGRQAVAAAHHLMLGHGLAVRRLREAMPRAELGIVLNLEPHYPVSPDPADVAAARLSDGMQNRIFLDPLLRGRYPDDVVTHLSGRIDLRFLGDDDLDLISTPIDVLGVNYYRPATVAARQAPAADWSVWPGDERHEPVPATGDLTSMGWLVAPEALEELLLRLGSEYPEVPLVVTENGAAFDDLVGADGSVRDDDRIRFLERHLRAVHRVLDAGVDVRGYFVWSLLDNFEWSEGYAKRFGLVHVDFATLQRTPKLSARWYADVISGNGILDGE